MLLFSVYYCKCTDVLGIAHNMVYTMRTLGLIFFDIINNAKCATEMKAIISFCDQIKFYNYYIYNYSDKQNVLFLAHTHTLIMTRCRSKLTIFILM